MKTKEELNALKEEVETVNKKLAELSTEELTQVAGGFDDDEYLTQMECDVCGHGACWVGNYMNGIMYPCPSPKCHAEYPSFHGVRYCC